MLGETGDNEVNDVLEPTDHETSIMLNEPDLINLNIKGVKSTESQCFICKSKSSRSTIPWSAIQQVWFELNIFVPKSNRTCKEHLDGSNKFKKELLQTIKATENGITVRNDDFVRWLHEISHLPHAKPCDLEDGGIETEDYEMFFGVKKEAFDDLLRHLTGN